MVLVAIYRVIITQTHLSSKQYQLRKQLSFFSPLPHRTIPHTHTHTAPNKILLKCATFYYSIDGIVNNLKKTSLFLAGDPIFFLFMNKIKCCLLFCVIRILLTKILDAWSVHSKTRWFKNILHFALAKIYLNCNKPGLSHAALD